MKKKNKRKIKITAVAAVDNIPLAVLKSISMM